MSKMRSVMEYPLQALADKISKGMIAPLIRTGDRAAVQQKQEPGGGVTLQRHGSTDPSEGALEAALLIVVSFLSGTPTSELIRTCGMLLNRQTPCPYDKMPCA